MNLRACASDRKDMCTGRPWGENAREGQKGGGDRGEDGGRVREREEKKDPGVPLNLYPEPSNTEPESANSVV